MPAGAMQEQEILAFAGFEDLDARAGRFERQKARFHSDLGGARHSSGAHGHEEDAPLEWRAPMSHSAATRSGTGSFIGWHQKRSSRVFQSRPKCRRCAITLPPHSFML